MAIENKAHKREKQLFYIAISLRDKKGNIYEATSTLVYALKEMSFPINMQS